MKRRRKEPPSTPFDANGPRRTVSATPSVTPSEDWPQTFEQIRSRTFKRSFGGYDPSQLQLFLVVAADLIDSLERGGPLFPRSSRHRIATRIRSGSGSSESSCLGPT